jgi:hypothetical protein
MPGPAGAVDDALEQALQAQLTPHAYLDGWRCRYAPVASADAPASVNTVAEAPSAAQGETDGASRRAVPTQDGASGAAAADGAVQIVEAEPAARPKPVPPALTREQREAGRSKALRLTAARKELRRQLQESQITLEQALAQDGEAARQQPPGCCARAASIPAGGLAASPRGSVNGSWPPWRP